MTPLEMLEYLFECGYGVADIAHMTRVSCTTIYRIINAEDGHSQRVRAKLKAAFDEQVQDEIKTFADLSWPGR